MSATSDIREYGTDSVFAQLNRKLKVIRKDVNALNGQSVKESQTKADTINNLLDARSIITALISHVRK
jgi:hypothetical protein